MNPRGPAPFAARMSRAALLVLLSSVAVAQEPPLALLLQDPSGNWIEGALGTLCGEAPASLPALADLGLDRPTALTGRSDERGVLRFAAPGPPRAGAALVTTEAGLGVLVPRLVPGAAQRVTLQPMAEITTASGSETFVLHARARTLAHGTVVLPPLRGGHVLLPAGRYEVWARCGSGWVWQRLELESGRRTVLEWTGPSQRVQSRGAALHPTGWPEVELCAAGGECALVGAAVAAPLTAIDLDGGVLVADRALPMPPATAPVVWPPADATPRVKLTVPAGAHVFSFARAASGRWHVLGGCRADGEGRARLPEPGDGDHWLLVAAGGRAPLGMPWSLLRDRVLAPVAGVPLRVRAAAPDGGPAVDVVVEFVPTGGEVAAVRARSDGRGHADLGLVAGPGTLCVSDARYANQELPLALVPLEPVALSLESGAALEGIAQWPDGRPARGVVVTLRDPSGQLRPAERAAVTRDDGRFAFPGLPADRPLLLFAAAQRDGRTWSGRRERLRAGGEPVELTLRDEDPVLAPR